LPAVWPLVAKPLVGAGIGWFTNWLAIRMLFRPRQALRVLGLTIQGVIPRRRSEIAERLAQAFERELLSHEDVKGALQDPAYQEALRTHIEDHVRDYLSEKVAASNRVVRTLIGGGLVRRLASGITDAAMSQMPSLIDRAAQELEARFDIREVVRAKVEALDLERLEALVVELSRSELRFIEVLGGIVGFVVGAAFAAAEFLL